MSLLSAKRHKENGLFVVTARKKYFYRTSVELGSEFNFVYVWNLIVLSDALVCA